MEIQSESDAEIGVLVHEGETGEVVGSDGGGGIGSRRIGVVQDLSTGTIDIDMADVYSAEVEVENEMNNQVLVPPTGLVVEAEDEGDDRPQATFRHAVPNFSKLEGTHLSESCVIRKLPWKIMIMPRTGPPKRPQTKYLGFFLLCDNSSSTSWSCHASAELRLLSQTEGGSPYCRNIDHVFSGQHNEDFGFSQFIAWDEVCDPAKGFIKDDTIIVEVHVMADTPLGITWDSKKYTGYVGLKNQGATCYMNSLLQTLYFTNELRKAVYKLPSGRSDSGRNYTWELPRVFHAMQFSNKPVGTKKLTKSFGWKSSDSYMQHDVQEFLRVLLDKLDGEMKRTSVAGTVQRLFEGKMVTYIKCQNIDYGSTQTESFYDIQLNIKGKKNIIESFDDYITAEVLDGDNKYDAGEHGLQDAEKGVVFSKFPPVLHLHLMRFEYDPITDCSVKFNDRFEFTEKLDLSKYLQAPESTPASYTLHAVLVHSGDNQRGHYVVFINPKGDGKWCKFDDDIVSRCSKREAIENNYGGLDDGVEVGMKRLPNAYMLVYIRDSELAHVLQDVTEEDIPQELSVKLEAKRRLKKFRWRGGSESHLYMTVHLVLERSFDGHQGHDLFIEEISRIKILRIKKVMTLREFLAMLSHRYKYAMEQMRLWPLTLRTNGTIRPTHLETEKELSHAVYEIADAREPWTVFLEVVTPENINSPLPPFNKDKDVLLFFKMYDPKVAKIRYCGHKYVSAEIIVSDLFPILNERAGFPPDTELKLYEEVAPNFVVPIEDYTEMLFLALDELMDGDIIIFEKGGVPEDVYNLPTCIDFFGCSSKNGKYEGALRQWESVDSEDSWTEDMEGTSDDTRDATLDKLTRSIEEFKTTYYDLRHILRRCLSPEVVDEPANLVANEVVREAGDGMDSQIVDRRPMPNVPSGARSWGVFQHVIYNFSKFNGMELSEACVVGNVAWRIVAELRVGNVLEGQPLRSLGFFLLCTGEPPESTCHVIAELRLLPQKAGLEPFRRDFEHVFRCSGNSGGFVNFLDWSVICDPERCFIKDDTIILEVHLETGLSHNYLNEIDVTPGEVSCPRGLYVSKQWQPNRITVHVVLEESFDGHQGIDLLGLEFAHSRTFTIDDHMTLREFMAFLSYTFKCPVEQLRIWPFSLRQTGAIRPALLDIETEMPRPVAEITNRCNSWTVYLEKVSPEIELSSLPSFSKENDILIFFKMYDPKKSRIYYCGHDYVPVTIKISELIPKLNERAGFPAGTELKLYKEISFDTIQPIENLNETLFLVCDKPLDGEILIYQKDEMEKTTYRFPTCQEYFRVNCQELGTTYKKCNCRAFYQELRAVAQAVGRMDI